MLQPLRMAHNPPQHCSIADEIRKFLAGTSYPGIRRVLWEFDGEVLVLEGTVNSYYLKQVVCAAVFKVAGIGKIVDRIRVCETTAEERLGGTAANNSWLGINCR